MQSAFMTTAQPLILTAAGMKMGMQILHRRWHHYEDQDHLSIQKFVLEICSLDDNDSESKSLLDKWIPIVFLDMGVKEFSLYSRDQVFDVPWVVFKAESLRKLFADKCKLTEINQNIILCKQLQTLYLNHVHIADYTFHKIMSSCPLIERVTLHDCDGLRNIKVSKTSSYNLNHFDICYDSNNEEDHSIEIDVPTIESIRIERCPNWYGHHNNYFPRLKSLDLLKVQLSKESLDGFSCNFPCLQVLSLSNCYDFEDFRLFSPSIKSVYICNCKSLKFDIKAPNLLTFDYTGMIPQSISLTTNSSQWKSSIELIPSANSYCDASSWLHKLHEMLRALNQSEIYLQVQEHGFTNPFTTDTSGELCEPLYIGLLSLQVNRHFSSSTPAFVDKLFRICRPRNIHQTWYFNSHRKRKSDNTKLIECMWRILVMERETSDYVWQQDLEEVSMEAFDYGGQKWSPVDAGTSLINCAALLLNTRQEIRFRLQWRELS